MIENGNMIRNLTLLKAKGNRLLYEAQLLRRVKLTERHNKWKSNLEEDTDMSQYFMRYRATMAHSQAKAFMWLTIWGAILVKARSYTLDNKNCNFCGTTETITHAL